MNDMNDNDNNFEPLRRLMALKRHEVPPPGYFNNFSGQVVSRIRSGAAKESSSVSKDLSLETPWLFKLLQAFSAKPAFASAFASALCLLLVFGIVLAERADYSAPQPLLAQATETSVPLASVSQATFPSDQTMFASGISSNSMSSLQPVASLFGSQNPFAQQVSFSIPGN
jgi:hypothetical protein